MEDLRELFSLFRRPPTRAQVRQFLANPRQTLQANGELVSTFLITFGVIGVTTNSILDRQPQPGTSEIPTQILLLYGMLSIGFGVYMRGQSALAAPAPQGQPVLVGIPIQQQQPQQQQQLQQPQQQQQQQQQVPDGDEANETDPLQL